MALVGDGVFERVSVTSDGTQANGLSHSPAINSDGRFMVFISRATNLVPDPPPSAGRGFVYFHDL